MNPGEVRTNSGMARLAGPLDAWLGWQTLNLTLLPLVVGMWFVLLVLQRQNRGNGAQAATAGQ